MRVVLSQSGKTITTKSWGDYPYSSGVTVTVNDGNRIIEEDFETEINYRGVLPINKFLVKNMVEMGFEVYMARKADRIYLTVCELSDDQWDEIYPVVLEGNEDLAWMLYDGDVFLLRKDNIVFTEKYIKEHPSLAKIKDYFEAKV